MHHRMSAAIGPCPAFWLWPALPARPSVCVCVTHHTRAAAVTLPCARPYGLPLQMHRTTSLFHATKQMHQANGKWSKE